MRVHFTLACVVPLAIAIISNGQSTEEAGELDQIKAQFEELRKDLDTPLVEFVGRYEEELKKLRQIAREQANLTLVLEIDKEMGSYKSRDASTPVSEQESLARLQGIYVQQTKELSVERAEKLIGMIAAYKLRLQELQNQLTKSNQLTEAVRVRDEIGKLAQLEKKAVNESATPEASKPLEEMTAAEILTSRTWVRFDEGNGNRHEFVFNADGTMKCLEVKSSWKTWEIDGNRIVMSIDDGRELSFELNRKRDPLRLDMLNKIRKGYQFDEKKE